MKPVKRKQGDLWNVWLF